MVEQTLNTGLEWFDIVDENNDVIAQSTRAQMRAQCLRHRATYIVVHNGMGQILVQKRTENKDFYPGWLDATAGGVVQSGENMLESARREAEEELGIAGVPFADHGMFYFEQDNCRVWGGLFSCVSHGPFALQEEEVESVRCMTRPPSSMYARPTWTRSAASSNPACPPMPCRCCAITSARPVCNWCSAAARPKPAKARSKKH